MEGAFPAGRIGCHAVTADRETANRDANPREQPSYEFIGDRKLGDAIPNVSLTTPPTI